MRTKKLDEGKLEEEEAEAIRAASMLFDRLHEVLNMIAGQRRRRGRAAAKPATCVARSCKVRTMVEATHLA